MKELTLTEIQEVNGGAIDGCKIICDIINLIAKLVIN